MTTMNPLTVLAVGIGTGCLGVRETSYVNNYSINYVINTVITYVRPVYEATHSCNVPYTPMVASMQGSAT